MPADPPLQFRLESCKLDIDACTDLCTMVLERNNISGQVTSCDVSFTGNSCSLKIYYENEFFGEGSATNGDNPSDDCAVPGGLLSNNGSGTL